MPGVSQSAIRKVHEFLALDKQTWIGVPSISEATGLERKQIGNCLSALVTNGCVERRVMKKKGNRNEYRYLTKYVPYKKVGVVELALHRNAIESWKW